MKKHRRYLGIGVNLSVIVVSVLFVALFASLKSASAAACQTTSNFGTVDESLTVTSAGNYRVWSRIKAPNATDNSYVLKIDGDGQTNCYSIGGSVAVAGVWTWVDDQTGGDSIPVDLMNLAAGNYRVTLIGSVPGVELDRLILTQDMNCIPTGNGSNCTNPTVTTPPIVSLSAPTKNAQLSGPTLLRAVASGSLAVSSVSFFADNTVTPIGTAITPPGITATTPQTYSYLFDTTRLSNGAHTITAKAIDSSGNIGTSSPVQVTVENGGSAIPSASVSPRVSILKPSNGAAAEHTIDISGTATDSIALSRIVIAIDGTAIDTIPCSSGTKDMTFSDKWNSLSVTNGTHDVTVSAYDNAGNVGSDAVTITVQNGNITPPSIPADVQLAAPTFNTVLLTWKSSTGANGLAGYFVLRNGVTIASVGPVTEYTDSTVSASTHYSYQLIAFDKSGNLSGVSNSISVTTPPTAEKTTPAAPTGLTATAVNSSQINLSWQASSETVGVVGYDIYRSSGLLTSCTVGHACPEALRIPAILRIATDVPSTSYGDTGLSSDTKYTYTVAAVDAAGNIGAASLPASATTLAAQSAAANQTGTLSGTISHGGRSDFKSAEITMSSAGRITVYSTNANGRYAISALPAGKYQLSYSALKFKSQHVIVTIKAEHDTTENIKLQPN